MPQRGVQNAHNVWTTWERSLHDRWKICQSSTKRRGRPSKRDVLLGLMLQLTEQVLSPRRFIKLKSNIARGDELKKNCPTTLSSNINRGKGCGKWLGRAKRIKMPYNKRPSRFFVPSDPHRSMYGPNIRRAKLLTDI